MEINKNRIAMGRALMMAGCLVATSVASTMSVMAQQAVTQQQQSIIVKGVITDRNGEPVIGANVVQRGTQHGTITDLDGKFQIDVPQNASLVVSFVGYRTQQIAMNGKRQINIVLEEDSELLDDVVVIGYGTQRKGDITSAVASVKAEDFNAGKIGDAAELVKGKIAGLSVVNSSGDPNAKSSIMLRGVNTLVGNVSPLVLVNGIEGDLSTVAPENIESIDVLKDASAAAIYGTRGANGVIIITTKSGHRDQKAQVSYDGYLSVSQWSKKADFMDTHDVIYGRTAMQYEGYDTDWLRAVSRKAGYRQNHNISVSGGSKNATYAANVQLSQEEGIMRKTGNTDFRAQLDYTQYAWNDILKFNFNALLTRNTYDLSNPSYAYRQAIIRNPSSPVYNTDGSYNENFDKLQYYNPVELQNEYEGDARNRFAQLVGNITIEPIKGWQTNLMMSWGESSSVSESWTSPKHYTLARTTYNGIANKSEGDGISKNLELTSRYKNEFGKHRVEVLAGYSWLYNVYDGFNAGNENFSTDVFKWNNLGNGSFINDESNHAWMGSYKNDNKLISFFGRVSYGYDDRYNLLVSLRHEGSSKFGDNHKWATFPSASAGWNITKESFMESTQDWLDNLRLRVGFGVTGVTPTDSYLAQNLYAFAGYGDILSMDGKWIKTLEVSQNPNKDLKWETTKEWNFGLDYSFFKGRLSGTIDYYHRTTDDLLYDYAVPVPPNLYGYTLANVGSMENKGIEVMISAIPIKTKDFEWTSTITLSHNSNKLKSLSNDLYETDNFQEVGGISDPISVATHCMEVGHTLGDFWGLKFVGYDKEGFALVEAKDANGDWTVKQFNANLNVKENRQRLGNGMPKVIFGWTNEFSYRGVDLSLLFTGQFGYKILNAMRCFYENNSIGYNRLKSAADQLAAINTDGTPALDENGQQLMVTRSSAMGQGFWSEHLEDGSFLKLSNVTLGYTIPFKGKIKDYLSRARVYVNATNLFCITSYSGLDPEVSNYFLAPGIDDRDKYPTTRSFSVGLSLNF